MQNTNQVPKQPNDDRPPLKTEQLAAGVGVKAQTLRQAYCRDGEYFGIRPTKAPNRFLLWPADAIERLLSRDRAK